jgi:ribosomal protein S25
LRQASAAVFGNEKLAETLVFVSREVTPVTAQMAATGTGINYSLARDALRRLVAAGVLEELPRTGGSRSPLYYRRVEGRVGELMIELSAVLVSEAAIPTVRSSGLSDR